MFEYNEQSVQEFKERISKVRSELDDACKAAGRKSDEVTLIGVSKVFPVECAMSCYTAGLKDLGENKVQELIPKEEAMRNAGMNPNWHLIGTLQKNKVKYIAGKVTLIHSVDSFDLAKEISKRSEGLGIVSDILYQVNISREESKHGFYDEDILTQLDELNKLNGIRARGLMTMAPAAATTDEARQIFADTRKLFELMSNQVKDKSVWSVLSMGMSRDFKEAVAEGSTHIRIGTDIFGDRKVILNAGN
ncbi:MAG: YggS family pyridoxal phosphate-dependent enzyme [Clostridia bacterium]|nr:YggS family pyridoxal phosphate-dependent enzyme [Clostridia bacterium]